MMERLVDYTEAIHLKPDYIEVYNNRGISQSMLGRYDEADCRLYCRQFV